VKVSVRITASLVEVVGCAERCGLFIAGLCAVAGCGRVNFEMRTETGDDARTSDAPFADGAPDAYVDLIGCSDGQREGFVDTTTYPTIAGCVATWNGSPSLRVAPTGVSCGDDVGSCAVPADACAPGWHVCMRSGDPTDLSSRIDEVQCGAGGGAGASEMFVAASSHCTTCDNACSLPSDCTYVLPLGCPGGPAGTLCAQPICCGQACSGANNCRTGVFPTTTLANAQNSCGELAASTQTGVLCCAD
jgi:hypothetical protein